MKHHLDKTITLNAYICASCGFCRFGCPVYKEVGFESLTVRGKMHLLKKVVEGKLAYDRDMVSSFYTCALCGNCNEICPSGIDYIDTASHLRRQFVKSGLLPESQKPLRNNIIKNGNPFAKEKDERGRWLPPKYREFRKSKNLYFIGCSSSYSSTRIARSIIRVLERAKFDFVILGDRECCCGEPLSRMGEEEKANEFMQRNIESFKELGTETLFASCAGCYKTLKSKYPKEFNVVHVTQLLYGMIQNGDLEFKKDLRKKIIYFDGCDIGRHSKTYEEPRNLLKALPGVELMEFDYNREEAVCCGGPFAASDPPLAGKIAGERVKEALDHGAEMIAAACPTCMINLREGARVTGSQIEIQDVSMLLPGLIK